MEKQVALGSLEREAETFLSRLEAGGNATIVGLYGELGSGKTTFVQHVARALGVRQPVTSPTFVIQKIYKLKNQRFDHLVHVDAYRLENSGELSNLGWQDVIQNPKNIVFIEWADRVGDILPQNAHIISFEVIDEETRKVIYDKR